MSNMIMSHSGISFVINVCTTVKTPLKMGVRKKTCPSFIYQPSDCELNCKRDLNVGSHKKYMNGNTGVFRKNGVSSTTHHMKSGATVYLAKATYQMNSVSGVYGDRIII